VWVAWEGVRLRDVTTSNKGFLKLKLHCPCLNHSQRMCVQYEIWVQPQLLSRVLLCGRPARVVGTRGDLLRLRHAQVSASDQDSFKPLQCVLGLVQQHSGPITQLKSVSERCHGFVSIMY
jgi:hypothetical protein